MVRDDDALRARISELVEEHLGEGPRRIEALAPGLGTRRFFRVRLSGNDPASVIARVEPESPPDPPPGVPPEPPLEPTRSVFERLGLPVPRSYGGCAADGIALLEDVGDESLEQAVQHAAPARRQRLYRRACECVPKLQAVRASDAPIPAFSRRLDAPLIRSKATKWLDWALPALLERAAREEERAVVDEAFAFVAGVAAAAPARLAHRDLKAANIHLRPGARGSGDEAVDLVLIDFQGAFLAPPEYDLVCLLRDSHVVLPEAEVQAHLEHVRPRLPDRPDRETFARRFDLLTLVRVAKDVAHYLHAARERGDARYLAWVPAGLAALRGAAERAAARDVALRDLAKLWRALPAEVGIRGARDAGGSDPCAP